MNCCRLLSYILIIRTSSCFVLKTTSYSGRPHSECSLKRWFPQLAQKCAAQLRQHSLSLHIPTLAPLLPFGDKLMVFTVEDLRPACQGSFSLERGTGCVWYMKWAFTARSEVFQTGIFTLSPCVGKKLSPAILTAVASFSLKPLCWSRCLQENNLTMIKLPFYHDLCPTRWPVPSHFSFALTRFHSLQNSSVFRKWPWRGSKFT